MRRYPRFCLPYPPSPHPSAAPLLQTPAAIHPFSKRLSLERNLSPHSLVFLNTVGCYQLASSRNVDQTGLPRSPLFAILDKLRLTLHRSSSSIRQIRGAHELNRLSKTCCNLFDAAFLLRKRAPRANSICLSRLAPQGPRRPYRRAMGIPAAH